MLTGSSFTNVCDEASSLRMKGGGFLVVFGAGGRRTRLCTRSRGGGVAPGRGLAFASKWPADQCTPDKHLVSAGVSEGQRTKPKVTGAAAEGASAAATGALLASACGSGPAFAMGAERCRRARACGRARLEIDRRRDRSARKSGQRPTRCVYSRVVKFAPSGATSLPT